MEHGTDLGKDFGMGSLTPIRHQASAILQLKEGKRGLFLPYGFGKTHAVLWATSHHLQKGTLLILCEKRNIDDWKAALEDQLDSPLIYSLTGPTKDWLPVYEEMQDTISVPARIILISYSILAAHLPTHLKNLSCQNIQAIVADESTNFKNIKASLTKACLQLSKHFLYLPKYILTGDPQPEGAHELWTQFEFTGKNPFGSSYYKFLNYWFVQPKYSAPILKHGMEPAFISRMAEIGVWLSEEDVLAIKKELGIPEERYSIHQHALSAEQRNLLTFLYENWCLPSDLLEASEEEESEEYSHTMTVLSKAQQICSGFFYKKDGSAVQLNTNPKLYACIELVGTLLRESNRKVVIWHAFKEETEQLINALPPLWHAVPGPNADALQYFKHSDECRVIIMPVQISKGFNDLMVADVNIFYSNVFSQEKRNQAEGRLPRIGSPHKVVYHIDLCSEDSRDMDVVTALQAKNLSPARLNAIVTKYMKGFDNVEDTANEPLNEDPNSSFYSEPNAEPAS